MLQYDFVLTCEARTDLAIRKGQAETAWVSSIGTMLSSESMGVPHTVHCERADLPQECFKAIHSYCIR